MSNALAKFEDLRTIVTRYERARRSMMMTKRQYEEGMIWIRNSQAVKKTAELCG